jgi:hypothetical protein
MHLFKLLAQFIARPSDQQAARESNWNALNHYLKGLTGALCASARHLLEQAEKDPSLQLPAAADAARGLHACRMMAKLHLVHYLSVPPKLWQLAYEARRLMRFGRPWFLARDFTRAIASV